MFCLTFFQIKFWAPTILTDSENLGPGRLESVKNIRGPKYIGVINRLHPQKQPFLQIHTNPGTALLSKKP